jgi:hypothetical protein
MITSPRIFKLALKTLKIKAFTMAVVKAFYKFAACLIVFNWERARLCRLCGFALW